MGYISSPPLTAASLDLISKLMSMYNSSGMPQAVEGLDPTIIAHWSRVMPVLNRVRFHAAIFSHEQTPQPETQDHS